MKTKIKRQSALRKRILAWQQNHLLREPAARKPSLAEPSTSFELAQRPEETRPRSGRRPKVQATHWPPLPLSPTAGPQDLFRAGQTWRRADLTAQFMIDFADAEQVEIRWLRQRQRGTTAILTASDLFFYVRANNLRADWAPDGFLK